MTRVKIDIPPGNLHSVIIPVRITDINYGNHLGNDALVSIIHEARAGWLRKGGYDELHIDGKGLIMADLAIEFKGEAFYGDQLTVTLSKGDSGRMSFNLYYKITTHRDNEEVLIAKAKTGMISFNYDTRKVESFSEKFIHFLDS